MLTDLENSFTVGNSKHSRETSLHYRVKHNKMLSYRRETALQGAL